jgi:hypothetical protein
MPRRVPDKAWELQLDDSGQEWVRVHLWISGGQVTDFMVQYETTLAGKLAPVVRYDTAHGYAHRDVLDRQGRTISKTPLGQHTSLNDAFQDAMQDVRRHWRYYQQHY